MRFGVPGMITTDQGHQFESNFIRELYACLGIRNIRTTQYRPMGSWSAQTDLSKLRSCHTTLDLPFVALGLCSVIKDLINATASELVYGTTLRLPSDFFQDTSSNSISEFVQNLKQTMRNLKPVPLTMVQNYVVPHQKSSCS
ncbi:integrase catalytic domain-containing protein [Trichonephila clavipes]|nr:integrase catalytic domain-containing protein [Trichonephila clavipes]